MKKVILFLAAAVVIIALIFGGVEFNEARLEMVNEKASSALLADSEISQYFEYIYYGTAIRFGGKDYAIVDLYFKNITSSELRQMESSEGIAFCKMVNKKTRSVLADLGYTDLIYTDINIAPSDTSELIRADTDYFVLHYDPVNHTVEIYTYRNSGSYVVWEEEVSW